MRICVAVLVLFAVFVDSSFVPHAGSMFAVPANASDEMRALASASQRFFEAQPSVLHATQVVIQVNLFHDLVHAFINNDTAKDPLSRNEELEFHFVFPMWQHQTFVDMYLNCPQVFSPAIYDSSSVVPFPSPSEIFGRSFIEMGSGIGYNAVRAKKLGATEVVASDVNREAVQCVQKNAYMHGLSIRAVVSDLFSAFDENERWDVCFFNIPWNTEQDTEVSTLSNAVSGVGPLLERFLAQLPHHLTPIGSGYLVICLDESSCMTRKQLEKACDAAGFDSVFVDRDDFVHLIRLDYIIKS